MTAIARHRTDKVYRELFSAWLGIQWDGTDLEDESKSLWNTINGMNLLALVNRAILIESNPIC
jgi:aldehyde:ferredoxin oxidoreductase